ncbi:hypothetical protein DF153_15505 [Burkholderia cenocepacia]|nr:hypothetical protein CFB81_09605 [Burkholderia sp. AU28863]RQU15518.1 hypothetical protein DF152_14365 [Burkholderia cenocepacia]RQU24357.1 hypothetical protein DF153_15505 [Burkholderia cenocepacia]
MTVRGQLQQSESLPLACAKRCFESVTVHDVGNASAFFESTSCSMTVSGDKSAANGPLELRALFVEPL